MPSTILVHNPKNRQMQFGNFFHKVEVHEKKNFAQKIEKYVKFNRPEGFFILRIFSKLLRIFKTIRKHITGKKKIYKEESVLN